MAEAVGTVPVAVVNDGLGVGVYQQFRIDQLGHHTVWRMMGEDTYAMAMEPSTNRDAGRWDARERGELQELAPGETRTYDLEIGALAGGPEIDAFERRVNSDHVRRPGLSADGRAAERDRGGDPATAATGVPPALPVLRGRLADAGVPGTAGATGRLVVRGLGGLGHAGRATTTPMAGRRD